MRVRRDLSQGLPRTPKASLTSASIELHYIESKFRFGIGLKQRSLCVSEDPVSAVHSGINYAAHWNFSGLLYEATHSPEIVKQRNAVKVTCRPSGRIPFTIAARCRLRNVLDAFFCCTHCSASMLQARFHQSSIQAV